MYKLYKSVSFQNYLPQVQVCKEGNRPIADFSMTWEWLLDELAIAQSPIDEEDLMDHVQLSLYPILVTQTFTPHLVS